MTSPSKLNPAEQIQFSRSPLLWNRGTFAGAGLKKLNAAGINVTINTDVPFVKGDIRIFFCHSRQVFHLLMSRFLEVFVWRHSGVFFENAGEIAVILEADFSCALRQRVSQVPDDGVPDNVGKHNAPMAQNRIGRQSGQNFRRRKSEI